ncbi:MAG: hypothetical protein SNJ71_02290, partial [Bacteroidales bacterium]
MIKLNKIRNKLSLYFFIFLLFSLLIFIISVNYYNKKQQVNSLIDIINQIHVYQLKNILHQHDFILYSTNDTMFYKDKTSKHVDRHQQT